MNPFELVGKRILVTGASSGIGRACAVCASKLGATVVLTGRRQEALDETQKLCLGGGHMTISGDITSGAFIKELVEKSGKLDGMVHSAGLAPMYPIGMLAADETETVMRTNYYSFLELMKYYSKNKYHGNSMSVVAVSSVSSRCGWAGGSIYCGSKGALSASVRALSVELAPRGVRVNAVCPSNVRTPLYESGAGELNDEDALMELIKKQPLGLGEPEQIAWPICFLLSEAASFITGIELPVDGGYLAK